jgi:hypothetical protein
VNHKDVKVEIQLKALPTSTLKSESKEGDVSSPSSEGCSHVVAVSKSSSKDGFSRLSEDNDDKV